MQIVEIKLKMAQYEIINEILKERNMSKDRFFNEAILDKIDRELRIIKKERRKSIPLAGLDKPHKIGFSCDCLMPSCAYCNGSFSEDD